MRWRVEGGGWRVEGGGVAHLFGVLVVEEFIDVGDDVEGQRVREDLCRRAPWEVRRVHGTSSPPPPSAPLPPHTTTPLNKN